jgi:hypothetical protein
VRLDDVIATTQDNGTLGYEDNYTIRGQGPNGGARLTWLPSQGQVISQGQILYKTGNETPIILMYGSTPDWRALSEGSASPARPATSLSATSSSSPGRSVSPRSSAAWACGDPALSWR